MTRPVLVIEQDLPLRGDGLVGRTAARVGVPLLNVRAWEESLEGVEADDLAGIVALGGSQHAWDEEGYPFLAVERRLLAQAHARGVPVLGICLGGQVLARALGAEVAATERPERGMHDVHLLPASAADPVLGVGGRARVYQWHLDVFGLPDGATLLASSPAAPVQAFRLGSSWGLQFHPEVDDALMTSWLASFPDACAEFGIDEAALRREVREREPDALDTFAARLLAGFLGVVRSLADRPRGRPVAPSAAPGAP